MADDWLSRIDFGPSDTLHADDLNNYGRDIRVWKGDVNGGGHHLANVIIDNYFPGAGYPLLSPIHVIPTSTDYTAQLRLDSEAAGNPARWVFNKDAIPETGSNAGSNFQLVRCNDDGSTIDAPIQINRATGLITLGAQQWAGNINGGGATLTNINIPSVFQDPTTTKGDLLVNNGAGLKQFPLGAATNGMVLLTDSSQPFGMKWAQSPAVPLTRQINTGNVATTGLSGGGPLTADLNLSAAVVSVFGRTGNVVLSSAEITGAGGVPNTFDIIAGAGLTGGGQLGAQGAGVNSITLTAMVQSVMGHANGAVVLNATDVVAMGGVPASRQVKPGSGMVPGSGGNLGADITLSALVTSVFGGTGDVQLTGAIITAAGGVVQSQHVTCSDGTLSGGGMLGTGAPNYTPKDIILSVVPGMTVQKLNFASNGSVIGSPRSTLNFLPGPNGNVRMGITDDGSKINVALDATGTTGIWHNNQLVSNAYAAINFIDGSNVSITATPNSSANNGNGWVDITISSSGGGGGGTSGSQTPWTSNIDAASNYLGNVSFIGVARAADWASPVTSANARIAIQANGPEIALRAAQAMSNQVAIVEADNDNGTAKVALKAYGSLFGGTLQGTSGLGAIAGPMTFAIAGSEAARITTAKRVLIGTSADDGNNLVQVNGNLKILPAGSGIVFPDGSLQTTAGGGGMSDPTTTKGDLIVHAAGGTTRLAAGTQGQVLISDSTNTNGVSWSNSAGQTPWATNIDGNGKLLQNAGGIGIGTYTIPITNPVAGRNFLSVIGSTDCGVIELATASADSDGSLLGQLAWVSPTTTTNTDKRHAVIGGYRSGSTTNNRGGVLAFLTKADGASAPTERMRIDNLGNVGIGLVPAYTLDVNSAGSVTARFLGTTGTMYFSAGSNNATAIQMWRDSNTAVAVGNSYPGGPATTDFVISGYVSSAWKELARVTSAGNVGVLTPTPAALLDLAQPLPAQGTYETQHWTGSSANMLKLQTVWDANGISQRFVQRVSGTDSNSLCFFNGNVGLGVPYPTSPLVVGAVGGYQAPSLTHGTAATAVFTVPGGTELSIFNSSATNFPIALQARHNSVDGQAYPLTFNPLGGNVGVGIQTPGMLNACTGAPIGMSMQVRAGLAVGDAGTGLDGLIQLGAWNFISGNNYTGSGLIGQSLAVKSTSNSTIYFTPVTHGSLGYTGIEFNAGAIVFYGSAGATNAGAAITPHQTVLLTAAGKLGVNTTALSSIQDRLVVYDTSSTPNNLPGNGLALFVGSVAVGLEIGSFAASPYGHWLQSVHINAAGNYYPLVLQPNGSTVGIGQTNPLSTLHVGNGGASNFQSMQGIFVNPAAGQVMVSVANTTGVQGGMFANNDGGMYMGAWTNTPLIFRTNNTEQMRIAANGYVGINTNGGATMPLDVRVATNAHMRIGVQQYYSGSACLSTVNDANSNITPMEFVAAAFAFNGGNVQIGGGGNAPGYPLDLWGSGPLLRLYNSTGSNNHLQIRFESSKAGALWALGSDLIAANGGVDCYMYSMTAGVVMTWKYNPGRIGIMNSNPGFALDVTGDCNISGTFRVNGTAINTGGITGVTVYIGGINQATEPGVGFQAGSGISVQAGAHSVGAYMACQINNASPSDERLKRNVRPLDGGLAVIGQMHVIEAEWNGLAETKEGEHVIGVMAQELQRVLPGCVVPLRKKLRPDDAEDAEVLHVNTYDMVMHLILAIQQLKDKVEKLEARAN